VRREDRGQFLDKILCISKASIDTCETHKSDLVEISKVLHAQITDILRTDFSFVVIQDVRFDLDRQTLDFLLLDFAFPTSR